MQLDKRRSRKRDAKALPQQTMCCAEAQRAQPQPPQPFNRKSAVEPERSRLRAVAAARDENRNRRRRKPAKRERKNRRRRRIEPLHVINRNQQRTTAALREKPEHRECDRPLLRRSPLDLLQQQSSGKRPTLRQRQPIKPLRQHGVQEITQRSERERRLGTDRTAREDRETLLARFRQRCLEQRCLPDARLAVQRECLGRVPPSREKVRQHGNLGLTADHRPAPCPPPSRHATLAGNPGAYLIRTAARRHSYMLERLTLKSRVGSAITQRRAYPPAHDYLERKQAEGKTRREAVRCLKRQLARTVYTTLKNEPLLT